jgi:hypothetical protein
MEFPVGAKIPDFIQALEHEDLTRPGTVAQIRLNLGSGIEAPNRVTLGAYPNFRLSRRDPRCLQEKTKWEVPVFDMKTLPPGDSAVVLYWEERNLTPGKSREVGFAYGLGSLAGKEGKGQLALTVGGSFRAGEEFTATAYVSNPAAGQRVTLEVPSGFKIVEGDATQPVPTLPLGSARPISPVTWRVRAPRREGRYDLRARLSTGASQTARVKISVKNIFGN